MAKILRTQVPSSAGGSKSLEVLRFGAASPVSEADVVAIEEPLEIKLRHRGRVHPVSVTMRTPGRDADLALGFLFTEGLLPPDITIKAGTQVQRNTVELPWPDALPLPLERLSRHSYTSSSCGVCGKTSVDLVYQALPYPEQPSGWRVAPNLLYGLPEKLRAAQRLFAQTGGIHAAGLFDLNGELIHFAEDVGRHNALDKVIGHAYREGWLPLSERILLLSGRASFELVQKAAMADISFVASVGAPSSLAVELAEDQGITLCGFLRGGGFNGYSGVGRVG